METGVQNTAADSQPRAAGSSTELSELGPYTIQKELGRGGMGVVYKARHTGLDRICALKVMIAGRDASILALDRFLSEAKTMASLDSHKHIVKVLDSGKIGDRAYIAMELVEGMSLEELIQAGKVKPRPGARVVAEIADALELAHSKGIIHRDIKPDNILVDRNSTVKLTDFGVAKAAEAQGHTMTGAVVGTLSYMSPEQAEDAKNCDQRSDVYGLGAVLYTILTGGRPPHVGATTANVMASLMTKDPPKPSSIAKVDAVLEGICLKAIARDVSKRYQSAAELRDALDNYRAGDFDAVDTLVEGPAVPLPVMIGAGLGAALLLLVALMMFGGSNKDTVAKAPNETPPSKPVTQEPPKPEPQPKPKPKPLPDTPAKDKVPAVKPTVVFDGFKDKARPINADTIDIGGQLTPASAELSLAGLKVAVSEGRFKHKVELKQQGLNKIAVVLRNGGIEVHSQLSVIKDTLPPEINLKTPKPGLVTQKPDLRLSLELSEPVSQLWLNGQAQKLSEPVTVFEAPLALKEGENKGTVVAADALGNRSRELSWSVVLDSTPPTLELEKPQIAANGDAIIRGRVSNKEQSVRVWVGGKEQRLGSAQNFEATVPAAAFAAGVVVRAQDAVGLVRKHMLKAKPKPTLSSTLSLIHDRQKWAQAGLSKSGRDQQDQEIKAIASSLAKTYEYERTKLFRCGELKHRLAVFKHRKTGVVFHLIPGGEFNLGLTNLDQDHKWIIKKLEDQARAIQKKPNKKPKNNPRKKRHRKLRPPKGMPPPPDGPPPDGPPGPGNGPKDPPNQPLLSQELINTVKAGLSSETPSHKIRIQPLLIARAEISVGEWDKIGKGLQDKRHPKSHRNLPMHGIFWGTAVAWCQRADKHMRLPSEAEWEYACRAGSTTRYFWGQEFDHRYARGSLLIDKRFQEVNKSLQKSAVNSFGLADMIGNVWEWCADGWMPNYLAPPPADGRPRRPGSRIKHVLRGGSAREQDIWLRVTVRRRKTRLLGPKDIYIGFRPVRPVFLKKPAR